MNNRQLYQVIFLCYLCVIVTLLVGFSEASDSKIEKHRVKRFLGFGNITRFGIRVNWKNNMVRWNQLYAEAIGFKLNYDDPPSNFYPYKHFQRREVYYQLETLVDKIGVNGFHCIRRAVCEIQSLDEPKVMYHRILKIIFRQQSSATDRWHNLTDEDCGMSTSMCPFSVLDVSLYTDM